MINPIDDFISRNIEPELKEILSFFSSGLIELVDFGSNLIKWDIERSIIQDQDLPAILFLRNFIEQIDSISILVQASSIEPCKNLLRTAVENLLYLEYLLEKDTYNRSMAFLIWNTKNNNKNIERLNINSEEYKKVDALFLRDKFMNAQKPPSLPNAIQLLEIGTQVLNMPKYQPFKNEYDRTKNKIKKNVPWYSLFDGPKSIKELAESLGHHILYDGFFRNYSYATHGTDILQGKLIGNSNEDLGILQIRDPKNAQTVTQNCLNFCVLVFSTFIKKRISEKQFEFNNWYLSIQSFNNKLCEKQLISPR